MAVDESRWSWLRRGGGGGRVEMVVVVAENTSSVVYGFVKEVD